VSPVPTDKTDEIQIPDQIQTAAPDRLTVAIKRKAIKNKARRTGAKPNNPNAHRKADADVVAQAGLVAQVGLEGAVLALDRVEDLVLVRDADPVVPHPRRKRNPSPAKK
jgi:hypothetical protein